MQRTSVGVFSLFAVCFFLGGIAKASSPLDEDYSLRRIATGVVGISQETVHGEAVAGAMNEWLSTNPRFELIPEAGQALRGALSSSQAALFNEESVDIPSTEPLLISLQPYQLHAVILAGIRREEAGYFLRVVLLNAKVPSLVAQTTVQVSDTMLLESFTAAARAALGQIEKQIPFQSTVLSREGYRMVLDRGAGVFRVGQQVSAFTLESWRGSPVFEETGLMQITRVDRNLAFARLVADKRPREIKGGNKVLFGEALQNAVIQSGGEGGRGLASLSIREALATRGSLGSLSLQLGPSFTQRNQSTATGELTSTGNNLYPGGVIQGELLLTSKIFLDLAFHFATSSVANTTDTSSPSLGSTLSQWRAQVGYRFGSSRFRPSFDVKAGYARQTFGIDLASEPFQFASRTYSSLWAGVAGKLPITDDFSIGLGANLPFVQSVTESPITSGAQVAGSGGLEIAARFAYLLNPQMDIDLKFAFESHSAEFSGQGTRTTPLVSSSERQTSVLAGLSYFF